MAGFHYFLVGMGSECYTVVLQDEYKEAKANLARVFDRVKYLRTEKKELRDWHGTRRLGNGVIKACWFTEVYSTKRADPLAEAVA